ncbi:phosphatidylserine synthase [Flavobacterium magnum]|uniref:Phosphatidylserine synthase n=1 Tax=Flavobacterium magnum TaxID=2162713 RepID=A0A2S0RIH1_9FLAO|nr:CDP-alcohol phosphatidyltransferase family protein [Flavobacterium magnum]AWA31425.1 phosphatidylserine synthase [Flavobacterium magnum]
MNIKSHVPNTITLGNLFCGCIAVVYAFEDTATHPDHFEMAFLFVGLGIFLDFFDGFFARLFKVSSPLGLQLDSLADMVTSGVTPGVTMFFLLRNASGMPEGSWIPYLGFLITLGSCYRLANFNIDTRQTDSFIGMPTPGNALFILSLPLVKMGGSMEGLELLTNQWVLLVITVFSTFIMNAEIPLFSLKFKKMTVRDNLLQISFLLLSVLLLVFYVYLAVPLIILSYIFLSILNNKLRKV